MNTSTVTSNAEAEPKVGIFWDYENCSTPANVPGYIVTELIRNAAHKFGVVTIFKAYLELSTSGISQKVKDLRSQLQSSGVSLTNCPRASSGRQDVVDKMLLVDMLTFAIDNPAPAVIMLISGDRDYVYAASVLRLRKYDIVLVIPPTGADITLRSQATVVLDWKYDIFSEAHPNYNPKVDGSTVAISTGDKGKGRQIVGGSGSLGAPTTLSTSWKTPELPFVDAKVVSQIALEEPQTPPKELLSLDPAVGMDYTMSPPGSSEDQDPRMFSNLIETLEGWRLAGIDKPLRSKVGAELTKKNPLLYQRAGVRTFGQYIARAKKANIVVLGATDVPGMEWIALADEYQGKVYPVDN